MNKVTKRAVTWLLAIVMLVTICVPFGGTAKAAAAPLDEKEVQEKLMALEAEFPTGMPYDSSKTYGPSKVFYQSWACAAYAYMISDRVFGDLPIIRNFRTEEMRIITPEYIHVGDIIQMPYGSTTTHYIVVVSKDENGVYVTEGNVSKKVRWGRFVSYDLIRQTANWMLTRYPIGSTYMDLVDSTDGGDQSGDGDSADGDPASKPVPKPTTDMKVSYRTHVQNVGWQAYVSDGAMSGTSGRSYRLEGINIKLEQIPTVDEDGNDTPDKDVHIQYTTHIQDYGWRNWSRDDEMSGTSGESKRLEAIKIKLTGADAADYSVYYRVHAQNYGWLGWAKDGQAAGTAGKSLRLEAIQIVVLYKDAAAPGNTYKNIVGSKYTEPYYYSTGTKDVQVAGDDKINLYYRTHVQNVGWQKYKFNGDVAGTSGRSLRLEGINIGISNMPCAGGIEYRTHIQNIGWESSWKSNGAMSGTSGRSLRLEAIQIRLTGDMANYYDVFYRVHAQNIGWMSWAKNGEEAGTAGHSYRLEAIQIVVLPKGEVPANDLGGIVPKTDKAFVKK